MSLRTVAEDTWTPGARTTCAEPTGWAVSMYSSTTARRMAALRSSSIGVWWRAGARWHSMLPSASRLGRLAEPVTGPWQSEACGSS